MLNATKKIAACTLVICATNAFSQNMTPEPLKNVAQLSASGSVDVQQDLLSISLTTSRDGSDAGIVQTQLKEALESALTQARLSASPGLMEVRTGNFNLYPRYNKEGKINGWQGSTELVLEGRDFARITGTAGKIQSLSMGNVSFALSREQRGKVEGEAQAQAIESFRSKASEVSKSFGYGSYALREVSVNTSDPSPLPRPRMMAMSAKSDMAEAPVPVQAGKSTVVVNISGSVQMLP